MVELGHTSSLTKQFVQDSDESFRRTIIVLRSSDSKRPDQNKSFDEQTDRMVESE